MRKYPYSAETAAVEAEFFAVNQMSVFSGKVFGSIE
jgi:hypothetical protein